MNDELDDRRLGRAVRSALGDIVASAPSSSNRPLQTLEAPRPPRRHRPMITLAAGLSAAAGVLGIVVLASQDADAPTEAEVTSPGSLSTDAAVAASIGAAEATTSTVATTATMPTTAPATIAPVIAGGSTEPGESTCGEATVADGATDVQTIEGDIDGDLVDDDVTLYSVGGVWHVNATSSVKGWASDTVVTLDVDDSATVSFEDIDYSLGAATKPPVAIMVTGQGPNTDGIVANFTFFTLTTDYCVAQWIYRNLEGVDEPFQWVTLQEPGHLTGMICEGAAGSRHYRLVDSEQNADGSWRVINRVLTHDFTRAEVEFLPEETVADSPDIASQYGDIVGCDDTTPATGGSEPTG